MCVHACMHASVCTCVCGRGVAHCPCTCTVMLGALQVLLSASSAQRAWPAIDRSLGKDCCMGVPFRAVMDEHPPLNAYIHWVNQSLLSLSLSLPFHIVYIYIYLEI